MKTIFAFLYTALVSVSLVAQTNLPVPINIKAAFDKGTRDMNGKNRKN